MASRSVYSGPTNEHTDNPENGSNGSSQYNGMAFSVNGGTRLFCSVPCILIYIYINCYSYHDSFISVPCITILLFIYYSKCE